MKLVISGFTLLILNFFIFVLHNSTFSKEDISAYKADGVPGLFISETENSHRHIILKGNSYHRGKEYGRLTKDILSRQEEFMFESMGEFIPNVWLQKLGFFSAMIFFSGLDDFIDLDSKLEMQGVAEFAPSKYESLASNLTRQLAYHGIHEVGQMLVDKQSIDMGCYIIGARTDNGWLLARNFDFDINGFFDKEKILKWSFPDGGIAYLSIIWSGMVGAVSGVNEEGLFASLNAAGSDDFSRIGTPTTIVVKNILMKATNIDEAIEILKSSQTFITEIFTLADAKSGRLVKIEKSPKKMAIIEFNESFVISNHLTHPIWKDDSTNQMRREELTTQSRYDRGMELLKTRPQSIHQMINLVRDKKIHEKKAIPMGNRGAIDSFIASQSMVFDLKNMTLSLSLGPRTIGDYLKYDLKNSFKNRKPIVIDRLKPLQQADLNYFNSFEKKQAMTKQGINSLDDGNCIFVKNNLLDLNFEHHSYFHLLGDYYKKCLKNPAKAISYYKKSLRFFPPYLQTRKNLHRKIDEIN